MIIRPERARNVVPRGQNLDRREVDAGGPLARRVRVGPYPKSCYLSSQRFESLPLFSVQQRRERVDEITVASCP